jgi:hypothetical protein
MKLFVSDFARNGNHPDAIAVCRIVPPGFKGKHIPELAPPVHLEMERDYSTFKAVYRNSILNGFDPSIVSSIIGDRAVLLSTCKIQLQCLTEWLSIYANIDVIEI